MWWLVGVVVVVGVAEVVVVVVVVVVMSVVVVVVVVTRPHVCHKAERACSQWAFPSCRVETSCRHDEAARERNHLAGLLSGGHNLRTKSTPSWGPLLPCVPQS